MYSVIRKITVKLSGRILKTLKFHRGKIFAHLLNPSLSSIIVRGKNSNHKIKLFLYHPDHYKNKYFFNFLNFGKWASYNTSTFYSIFLNDVHWNILKKYCNGWKNLIFQNFNFFSSDEKLQWTIYVYIILLINYLLSHWEKFLK